jgi:cell division septation protein DedD
VRVSPTPQVLTPQRDGSVLAAGARGGEGVVWVLRPPTPSPTDSVRVPGGARAIRTGAGDRVYFAGGDELRAVQARTLVAAGPVALGSGVRAAAASPSGDRLFVLTERSGEVRVVDRYAGAVVQTVQLPGDARDLRVDPLGRYLLVRPIRGDSAWVVAVGTARVVGAAPGAWRDDLPLVLPDGAILAAQGADVTVTDAETLRQRTSVPGGAADFWHMVLWNGFRPRAAGLDQPATFREARAEADDGEAEDSAAADDSTATPDESPVTPPESTAAEPPAAPPSATPREPAIANASEVAPVTGSAEGEVALPRPIAQPGAQPAVQPAVPPAVRPRRAARRAGAYTVQFAAAPSEREARRALARLKISGTTLRVVPRAFDGQTVYRVVAGPFASRAEAERVGRAAGAGNYWVYGGAP